MSENLAVESDQRCLSTMSEAIRDVAERFISQPASFLSEADLQGLIFAQMFNALSDWPVEIQSPDHYWKRIAAGKPLSLNRVKAQYSIGPHVKCDITVLPAVHEPESDAWRQPLRAAIEIKFWQTSPITSGDFRPDFDRLKEYADMMKEQKRRFTGICLIFCRQAHSTDLAHWLKAGPLERMPPSPVVPEHGVKAWAVAPRA